jgi:NADP-dependent 3-hydroxy acid dehydrogenase YdfG
MKSLTKTLKALKNKVNNECMERNLNEFFSGKLSGKKVLISGGSTGIGREIALWLCSIGADVLICGRTQQPLDETTTEASIKNYPGKCISIQADIAQEKDIQNIISAVDSQLGALDILIHNAGLAHGSITEGSYADWANVMNTNLLGCLALSHHAISRMKEKGSGHIINIGSMSAQSKDPESSVYVATKSGMRGFTESLRKEVNEMGIKVTLIEPGAVDTDMQEDSKEEKLKKIENLEMLTASDIAITTLFCLMQPQRSDIVTLQIRPHLQLS